MDNNTDLPQGWAMPPDMARRLSEGVNKRSVTPEDKLQKALDELARDIACVQPNTVD